MLMTNSMRVARIAFLALTVVFVHVPTFAQIDLSGGWSARSHEDAQERGAGPDLVDYLGLPLSEEGRARALSYSPSALSMLERQCLYYAPPYLVSGPFGLKMWSETDPINGRVVAWKIGAVIDRGSLTIWMDGRPRPSEGELHSFGGFTTGVWEGHTLTTYTTHFKEGYLRRNGVPSSDQAFMTMHFTRHGDILTTTAIIEDPIYLTEPLVISRSLQLDPNSNMSPIPRPCVPEAEVPTLQGDGAVPHYLLGKNPFVDEFAKKHNLPVQAALGGADTMYPEYRKKLKDTYVPPEKCSRNCGGPGGGPGGAGAGAVVVPDR
jgi:hypothetical protein